MLLSPLMRMFVFFLTPPSLLHCICMGSVVLSCFGIRISHFELFSFFLVFLSFLQDLQNCQKSCFATCIYQFLKYCKNLLRLGSLDNQRLSEIVKIFLKKSLMIVWSVIEKYLPLHPQSRGTPLEVETRKSSLKIFSIQTSSTRSDLVMSSQDWVIERTVKLISF